VAKQLDGQPVAFPAHVTPLFVRYLEPASSTRRGWIGFFETGWRSALKIVGNLWLGLRVIRPVALFRPDIVHVHTPLPLVAAICAKALRRCPLVLSFHGTDFERFRRSRLLRWLVAHHVNYVTCVAPDMVANFATLVSNVPAAYMGNGVDLEVFHHDNDTVRHQQLVTLGRLVWQKGYPDLLRALTSVFRAFPHHRILIIGRGSQERELRRMSEEFGISQHVVFTGTLSQGEVARVLRESELFVMSSVSEGFPKALLEAMASGLPVVVTNVGACGDVAKSSGSVVPPHQPDALADAICHLLSNPAMRAACSARALQDVQQYTWAAQADRMRVIYERLVDGSGPATSTPR
jgi:glycosyltransferase involved in cell wall biosynthesis